jgi:peroxiredoxin
MSSSRLLLALSLALGVGASALHAPEARAAGEQIASFKLRNTEGVEVALADYAGQVVLINFWATWCQPCQVEMPHLQKMYTTHKDKGFVVLSISADDARSSSQVKPMVKRAGLTFPVLLDTQTTVVSQLNPNKILPYTILLDRQHKVVEIFQGYTPGDEVKVQDKLVATLAASPAGTAAP